MTSSANTSMPLPSTHKVRPAAIVRIDGVRACMPVAGGDRQFARVLRQRRAARRRPHHGRRHRGLGRDLGDACGRGAVIRDSLGRAVLGMDVRAPAPLWDAMERTLGYDRRGVSHMAFSAIDIAVWDAAARMRGRADCSAARRRAARQRVPAYVSGPFLKPGADPYRDFDADIDGYLRSRLPRDEAAHGRRAAHRWRAAAPRARARRRRFPADGRSERRRLAARRARLRRRVPRVATWSGSKSRSATTTSTATRGWRARCRWRSPAASRCSASARSATTCRAARSRSCSPTSRCAAASAKGCGSPRCARRSTCR